eukprot:CAMPEP_0206293194 /NCGR_PEP_ID=MMETSP0106_2-20121207/4013_1 /ASSEMBLY_ACC=CAM_ASM_000206 /TAXON_ID=81532 /ORGANISM="Acanthoeca-like sp., Strain 10tr" /LENGTH=55 /DNA_ID=CAMNT_0053723785 /DNA_START=641 /DNA_END=808 /DNA_ORIENTATION=+
MVVQSVIASASQLAKLTEALWAVKLAAASVLQLAVQKDVHLASHLAVWTAHVSAA